MAVDAGTLLDSRLFRVFRTQPTRKKKTQPTYTSDKQPPIPPQVRRYHLNRQL